MNLNGATKATTDRTVGETTALWDDMLRAEVVAGKREVLQRFFKTGPGEYGEGDVFLGVTVPAVRKVSRIMADAPFSIIGAMLESPAHEHRLSALLVLVEQYRRARRTPQTRRVIVDFYLTHTSSINNWDLVDLSAPKIIGEFVSETGDHDLLHRLSHSADLWEQRIAIVATWTLLRDGEPRPTLEIAARYLPHTHDLIHKATGWMLREMGKRVDQRLLTDFLDNNAPKMPRTMLRYAIEKLPAPLRHHYLTIPRQP